MLDCSFGYQRRNKRTQTSPRLKFNQVGYMEFVTFRIKSINHIAAIINTIGFVLAKYGWMLNARYT